MRLKSLYSALVGVLLLAAFSACGQSGHATYPSKGSVTWRDGSPAVQLAQATIELKLLDGTPINRSPRAEIDSKGSFSFRTYQSDDGVPAGSYAAVIMPVILATDESRAHSRVIDSKYENFTSTPLRVVIEPKDNTISLVVDRFR